MGYDTVATDLRLEGARLIIRKMRHRDLSQMDRWRPFSDPLHHLWNLPRGTSLTRQLHFTLIRSDPTKLWFAVERRTDHKVIGSLTLREVQRYSSARLGIGFGADYVDRGYGTETLCLFLPYYFKELGFQRLILDVAATNQRARHVYQKLGFVDIGRHYRNIPDGESLDYLEQEHCRPLRKYFRHHFGHVQLQFYDMLLERKRWVSRSAGLD